jgi:hypothetical protein
MSEDFILTSKELCVTNKQQRDRDDKGINHSNLQKEEEWYIGRTRSQATSPCHKKILLPD